MVCSAELTPKASTSATRPLDAIQAASHRSRIEPDRPPSRGIVEPLKGRRYADTVSTGHRLCDAPSNINGALMKTTIDLLDRARGDGSDYALAHRIGVTPAALSRARAQGRVSPDLAARLAELLDDDPIRWIAIAAVEQMDAAKQARWMPRVAAFFAGAVVGVLLTMAKPTDASIPQTDDAKSLFHNTNYAQSGRRLRKLISRLFSSLRLHRPRSDNAPGSRAST